MVDFSKCGFATKQIHVGKHENSAGALTTPIYQTSTFEFDSVEQGGRRFAGQEAGYIYTRLGNPTVTSVEEKVAALEGGEAALGTAAGMGAISSALWSSVVAGDEIVASDTLYGCTFALLNHGMTKFGVSVKFIDMANLEAVKAALSPATKVVYLETPCNPTLKVVDIEEIAKIAHGYNKDIRVIVDNTFASPYLQQPLKLGADTVVHSATKYINGHGDLLAGFVVSDAETINQIRLVGIKDMTGAFMPANEAFLVARGLKTLEIRMQRHCENAMKVAQYLKTNDKVEKVFYPGLEDHEGHEIAKKQMHGLYGGMVSFIVKGGREKAAIVADNVKVATLAVSLGATETLIEHPASMTHSPYTEEELEAAGIPAGLIRFSVGLENPEDIIADLQQAFDKI